ncbi:vacuolar protein sorting-associated protein 26-domain-containing protein [Radiomyces spectabilis]|uniref:vacuolar protein sorting-associated protein 26-domain-containing protein n=1 Tax=Radiomyces spectabilis TaxID=64574 RepID=UPI0022204B66|nr:vacuolar protein sorting-associated protein 26-domain-containing protein [Radiomyces spectabilis]KAI8368310.1 vacuolar protein sorting-associated protein 26-domain-containing protein [Radiomyces spectabilis]
MNSLFALPSPVELDIVFDDESQRQRAMVKMDPSHRISCPVYADGEAIAGKVTIRLKDGRRTEHAGIKVDVIGSIDFMKNRKRSSEFLHRSQELAAPGELSQSASFKFEFKNVEKTFECYRGANVRLRYFVRVTVARRLADIVQERDLWVYSYDIPNVEKKLVKMEIGIEDCLHLEFEYNKSSYHLKDVIVGKIYFLLVRIKIKNMDLSVIRREITGTAPNVYKESQTLTKFEIMDGAPVRGEAIPIRLFLGGFELGPTFNDVNKKFSVRYYLNLVLTDDENRRYFKQQEITMYRSIDSE